MTPTDTIREVFGGRFDGDSLAAWRAFWSVAFGEAEENSITEAMAGRCTGRTELPGFQHARRGFIVGRRGGQEPASRR